MKQNSVVHSAVLNEEAWAEKQAAWIARHGEAVKNRTKPLRVGRVRKEGWLQELPIYMVWCRKCERHTVSHLGGYGRLTCPSCRAQFRVMTWHRFRDKVLRPLSGWGLFVGSALIVALFITYMFL